MPPNGRGVFKRGQDAPSANGATYSIFVCRIIATMTP